MTDIGTKRYVVRQDGRFVGSFTAQRTASDLVEQLMVVYPESLITLWKDDKLVSYGLVRRKAKDSENQY